MNKPAQSAVPGAISQGEEPPRTAAGAWFRWATINGDSILVFLLIPSRSLRLGGGFLVFSGGGHLRASVVASFFCVAHGLRATYKNHNDGYLRPRAHPRRRRSGGAGVRRLCCSSRSVRIWQ